jgi:hypothetical protein
LRDREHDMKSTKSDMKIQKKRKSKDIQMAKETI